MEKVICIHHGIDQDGWSSAAIVKNVYSNAELIGFDHGNPIPKIPANAHLIICDVAFPMEKMEQLADISESFTWIDHHISTINTYKDYCSKNDCRNWKTELPKDGENVSACELTWRHFYGSRPPKAIQLLGAFDTFRHKDTPDEMMVRYFQNAADVHVHNPDEAKVFLHMSDNTIEEWIEEGRKIHEKETIEAKEKYKTGKPTTIDGYKFLIFDSDRFNPANYGIDYYADGYDGVGSYRKDPQGIWHLSLYNANGEVDCSAICKKLGGGGHKGAAGCEPSEEQLKDILDGKYSQPF